MATKRISILNGSALPDTSGSVYLDSINSLNSNDFFPSLAWAFADTATRLLLRGSFRVPPDYVGTAVIGVIWATTATSGNSDWEFDYRAIADGETFDPTTNQESVDLSPDAAPGTARLLEYSTASLTSANLTAHDIVQFAIARDNADGDTIAATEWLIDAFLQYSDV